MMTEKEFLEYKKQFRILSKTRWIYLDRAELESIFHESLAKAYLNYDKEKSDVKFSTYLYHIYNRDVYINLVRPKKYVKNQMPMLDINSQILLEDEDIDNYFPDRFTSVENEVLFNEFKENLNRCIEEYINRKVRLKNCSNTRAEHEILFDMWKDEYDVNSICEATNMGKYQVQNLMKSFRKKYRENFVK